MLEDCTYSFCNGDKKETGLDPSPLHYKNFFLVMESDVKPNKLFLLTVNKFFEGFAGLKLW